MRRGRFGEALYWMEKSKVLDPGHAETKRQIECLKRLTAEAGAGVQ